MSYRVIVPLVLARDKEGKVHERYQDAVIDFLDDDQKRHFVEAKLVEKVGGAEDAAESDEDGPPAKSASKPDWVDYAVAQGYDREEVEAMNKPDIQALDFG